MKKLLAQIKRSLSRPYTTVDKILTPFSGVIGLLLVVSGIPIVDKLIGIFGLLTIMLRVSSKMSFGLALVCLIDVPLLSLIGKQSLSEKFAVYAFYFLVIGVINSLLEDQQAERDYLAYKAGKRTFRPVVRIIKQQTPASSPQTPHKKKPPLVSG